MKNLFAALVSVMAIVAPLASAQGLNDVPQCARSCVTTALSASGCGVNIGCICGNKALISKLSCCVKSNCDAADQTAALKFAQSICKLSGITTLPTSASCASTTAPVAAGSASTVSATTSGTMTGSAIVAGTATMMTTGTATAAAMSSSTGAAHAYGVGGGVLAGAVGVAALVL